MFCMFICFPYFRFSPVVARQTGLENLLAVANDGTINLLDHDDGR